MNDLAASHRLFAPAAERNRQPILDALKAMLHRDSHVLELASGTGQHAAFFVENLPGITWQPSDPDPRARASIQTHVDERRILPDAEARRLRSPLSLDAVAAPWPGVTADAIVCINMVHIAPWEACLGLLRGAAAALSTDGLLLIYGPFADHGEMVRSNADFDASLRQENPAWGVRDLRDLEAAALAHRLRLAVRHDMPASNLLLSLERTRETA